MDSMVHVSPTLNALPKVGQPLEHVLHHLEYVVYSLWPVVEQAVPIIPMQLSIPSMLLLTQTHVPTLSVKPIQMYAN